MLRPTWKPVLTKRSARGVPIYYSIDYDVITEQLMYSVIHYYASKRLWNFIQKQIIGSKDNSMKEEKDEINYNIIAKALVPLAKDFLQYRSKKPERNRYHIAVSPSAPFEKVSEKNEVMFKGLRELGLPFLVFCYNSRDLPKYRDAKKSITNLTNGFFFWTAYHTGFSWSAIVSPKTLT